MWSASAIRNTGLFAMVGGFFVIVWAALVALRPAGCIGADCNQPGSTYRDWSDLGLLFAVAGFLLLVGILGLIMRARAQGAFGILGRAGLGIVLIGILLLTLSAWLATPGAETQSETVTVLTSAGLGLIGLGFLLVLGMCLMSLPPGIAIYLGITTIALAAFNDQDARVLLAVPFGVGWVLAGLVLWTSPTVPASSGDMADA